MMVTSERCGICGRNQGRRIFFEEKLLRLPKGVFLVACKCGLIRIANIEKYLLGFDYNKFHEKRKSFEPEKGGGHAAAVSYIARRYKGTRGKCLDIGCGSGDFLLKMSEMGWDVTGFEVSLDAVAYCRKRGLNVLGGDFLKVRFKEQFDLITMVHVLEHVSCFPEYLEKACSLLKDNGELLLVAPLEFRGWWYLLYKHFNKKALVDCYWRETGHLSFFTPKLLQQLLKRHKFVVKKTEIHYKEPGGRNWAIKFLRKWLKIYRDIPVIEVWGQKSSSRTSS